MEELTSITAGGLSWLVVPACRDLLLGPHGLRLEDWLRTGQARVIKHGPHRTVYRLVLPELDVYIKHYRLMDGRTWLREWVRPAKAWREYDRARAVAARGIPTVMPVAVGYRPGGFLPGESFLVTRSLEGAEALATFLEQTLPRLEPCRQARLRQRLARELGRFVARLHQGGILHDDLHAGNLLVCYTAADTPTLFLIDLHAIRLKNVLSWRARRANLVLLNRYFSMRASRTDRLRFWRAYAQFSQLAARDGHQLAREVETRTWTSNLRFWRQRDGRCLGNNRYFRKVASAQARGHAVADLDPTVIQRFLVDPDAPLRQPGVKLLKDSRSATVAELELPMDGVLQRVIYKRFHRTHWSDGLADLVRPSAALRSWIHGHGLRERGLPTPRPLLLLQRYRRGWPAESYLLMERVPDALDLHACARRLAELPAAVRRPLLRRCIDQAARLVRELHRRQLAHRDLKATNILARHAHELNRNVDLWLIDLVGVRRSSGLSEARKVQNLARLHVSFSTHPLLTRTDKLRFLRSYQQWGLFGKQDWKRWWRRIAQATQAKLARNRRSGRPLG